MARYPSRKGAVCKTAMHGCDSHPRLQFLCWRASGGMAYTKDLKSFGRKAVRVRLPPCPFFNVEKYFLNCKLWTRSSVSAMHYVYVLRSIKNKKRYVGSTSILPEIRLKQHNQGSNKWTKQNGPFELVHNEEYSNLTEARKRENFLKSGFGRKFLDSFLKNGPIAQLVRAFP